MYYLIYKTTNLLNNKFYIGKHKTNDLNDDYIGSGIYFNNAVNKYGRENFKREILFECSSEEEMNQKESEIVNEEFLKRNDVYNLKLGGLGGFDFINKHNLAGKGPKNLWKKIRSNPERLQQYITFLSNVLKKYNDSLTQEQKVKIYKKISQSVKLHYKKNPSHWIGLKHNQDTKDLLSQKLKGNPLITGRNNGMFNKRFIHNIETKKNQILDKNLPLPQGYAEGRYIRYNVEHLKIKRLDDKKLLESINLLLVLLFADWRKYSNQKFDTEKKVRHTKYVKPSKYDQQTVEMWYQEYLINGYEGVVEKFNYNKSCPNLVGIFKGRIPGFKSQQGIRRKKTE